MNLKEDWGRIERAAIKAIASAQTISVPHNGHFTSWVASPGAQVEVSSGAVYALVPIGSALSDKKWFRLVDAEGYHDE